MTTETQTETENQESEVKEERYLRLGATPNKGDKVVVKMRLLDYPGVSIFRHWIGPEGKVYPFICPGRRGNCPACAERAVVKLRGDDWKALHRMDHRLVVNILNLNDPANPKLQTFQIGPAVEKRLKAIIDSDPEEDGTTYADPNLYDIKVSKRKYGAEMFNVEYEVFQPRHRALTPVEEALASNKYDLTSEITPARPEDIFAAMQGQRPGSSLATPEQRAEVEKALKNRGLSFLDIRILDPDALTTAKAEEILKDLG